jgi:exodeoxyribonuclease V beta subunit
MRFLVAMQGFPSEPRMGEGLAFVLARLPSGEHDATIAALARATRELHESTVPLDAVLTQLLLPWIQQRAAGRKRSAGRFDFSDMLGLVADALADPGPAGVALLTTLRRRYRYALIDEFQDTDEIQWSIFRRIFVEAGDGHALTVIGDPKQAIYGFRGADVHTYLQASQALHQVGGNRLVLDRNFRSSAPMIEATNALFDQQANFFRPASGMTYQPVLCGREDLALVDALGVAAPPVVVLSVVSDEASPKASRLRAAIQTAIVDQVRGLLDPASPLRLQSQAGQRRIGARNIFILTFTNVESHAIGRALGGAGIPFAFYKLGELFASPEAGEILVLLRAIADPDNRNLRAQALLTSFFGLELADAAVWADLGLSDGPAQRLLDFAALAKHGDIPGLFAALVDDSGIVRREVFAGAGERSLTNVLHVLEILQAEWMGRHSSVEELADILDAFIRGTRKPPGQDRDLQRLETDKDAVQILTVHKAKGLEADVVFLYGGTGENRSKAFHVFHENGQRILHVGRLDAWEKQRVNEDKQDESARLLYVALTRARYRLYLPYYPMALPMALPMAQLRPLSGHYGQVNRRLRTILEPGNEQGHGPFSVIPIEASLHAQPAAPSAPQARELPVSSVALLDEIHEPPDVAEIRERRSGFRVTSYSAIKRAHGGFIPVEDHTDLLARAGADLALAQVSPTDELPGGPETGIFLHALLEKVTLSELVDAPSFAHWLARPQVARLVDKVCRRHARPAGHGQLAARLVHGAYTTPVRLGSSVVAGLAKAANARREMEFLFPIPEQAHPRLAHTLLARGEAAWKVERGVVKGFIDFLFEHDGKVFVCDWKSDHLSRWDRDTVARHCQQNYDVQARIYTMAVVRLCGITTRADWERRFGGILFCFLRGLQPDDDSAGIHFRKPSWEEIQSWETDMLGRDFWGNP